MPFLRRWSPDGVSFVGHVAPASGPPAPRASVRCQNRSPRSQNPAPPPAPEQHGQSRERPGCLGLERCTRSRGEVTAARCPIGTSLGCTGVARYATRCLVALRWRAASDPMSETAGLAHAANAATGGTRAFLRTAMRHRGCSPRGRACAFLAKTPGLTPETSGVSGRDLRARRRFPPGSPHPRGPSGCGRAPCG